MFDVCVIYINEEMKIVVVEVIVLLVLEDEFSVDYVIFVLFDKCVVFVVVKVVVKVVMEIGVVRIIVDFEEVVEKMRKFMIIGE